MKGLSPIDVDLMNLADAVIYRERNNIDVLLVSEENKLVMAIENKIGTGEHSDQLNRYRKILFEEYGEKYRYVLIFLSPEGVSSSDTENWVSMSYDFVLSELNKLIAIYKISDKSKLYINDYINVIRRNIVVDKDLKELCKNIYFKHKEAFDLIFENKPDLYSEIADFIYNYLKSNEEKYDITVWNDYSNSYIRFTPNKLVELYGNMGSEEWYRNKNLVAIEIQNYKDSDLAAKVIIGPSKNEFAEVRQKLLNAAINKKWKMQGQKLTDKWKTIKTNKLVSKEKLNFDNMKFVDDMISIPIERFLENEMPEIIETLSKNI